MFIDAAAALRRVDPAVWVYFRKGELVAHQGAIPVLLKLGEEELETGWFVETMVLERARGGPVGAALVAQSLQDMPFNLSLGQSPLMRELQYKLGWRKVGPLNTYAMAIDVDTMLARRPLWQRLTGGLALQCWNALKRAMRRAGGNPPRIVERLDVFDERHDALWQSVRPKYPCAVVRDAAFLNWKFVRQPGQAFWRWHAKSEDGQVRGVAVTRECPPAEPYDFFRTEICELVVDPDDTGAMFALLEAITDAARAAGAGLVFLHVREDRVEAALRRFGFIKRTSTRWLLIAAEPLTAPQRALAEDIGNWLLTCSDSDIDRP